MPKSYARLIISHAFGTLAWTIGMPPNPITETSSFVLPSLLFCMFFSPILSHVIVHVLFESAIKGFDSNKHKWEAVLSFRGLMLSHKRIWLSYCVFLGDVHVSG